MTWLLERVAKYGLRRLGLRLIQVQSQAVISSRPVPTGSEAAVEVLGDVRCQRVGLVRGGNDWEYPVWSFLRTRFGADVRVWHVMVENASSRLAGPEFDDPCALLIVGREDDGPLAWRGRTFVERWRENPESAASRPKGGMVRVYRPAP
jgi:hypothetical protein